MEYLGSFLVLFLSIGSISCANNSSNVCPEGNVKENSTCKPCPVDTFKQNKVKCKNCSSSQQTWGRKGVNNSNGCTERNPINVTRIYINIHSAIQPGTAITTFHASYGNSSLVEPPLMYYITKITKNNTNARSNRSTWDDSNSCNELGNLSHITNITKHNTNKLGNLSHPFCIFKTNGSILVNKNFSCMEGDQFIIKINVSDSAGESLGKIWNTNGSVTVTCTDPCKNVRQLYDKASNACNVSHLIPLKNNYTVVNNDSADTMQVNMQLQTYDINTIYLLRKEIGKVLDNCSLKITYQRLNRSITNTTVDKQNATITVLRLNGSITEIIRTNTPVDFRVFKVLQFNQSITHVITTKPTFDFSVNDTIKVIQFEEPLRLRVSAFNISMVCSNVSSLSNITKITFITKQNCAAVSKTCLKALYNWKNRNHPPGCKEDSFKLLERYGQCIACPEGYANYNNTCKLCPVDSYKNNLTQKCKECERPAKTWGRKGVTNSQGCTEGNPINVTRIYIEIRPDIQPGTAITTFHASYDNSSLVIPPLMYYITNVAKNNINARSNRSTWDDFNSCNEVRNLSHMANITKNNTNKLGNLSHPFCIFKNNGSILVNKNFSCMEGDQFIIKINASDSAGDSDGKIWNTNGSVTVTCTDPCKNFRKLYDKASKACNVSHLIPLNNNYTVVNNDSADTMQVKIPLQTYDINTIYLRKEIGKVLNNCSLTITYQRLNWSITNTTVNYTNKVSRLKWSITHVITTNTTFEFSVNDIIKVIQFEEPIRLPVPAFNVSMVCSNVSSLSNITKILFITKHYQNCNAVNKMCLNALYNWKNRNDPRGCKEDSSKLRERYGQCIDTSVISWPKSLRVTYGRNVRLYCNVTNSSPIPVNIEWFKDNITVGYGNILSLEANTTNQGFYECKVYNFFRSWKIRTALVVLDDYFTSYVKMEFNPSNGDCNEKYKTFAQKYRGKYITGPRKSCNNDGFIECTLYGKKNSQSLDQYYDNLKDALQKLKIGFISVKDAESCLKEDTGKPNLRGVFAWNSTGNSSPVRVKCPYESNKMAIRKCRVGNFDSGATWDAPNITNCPFKKLTSTEALDRLTKTKVTSNNTIEVAKNLAKIFNESSSKDLTGEDANRAANLLEKIVLITGKLNETAWLVLDVINTIMDMNESALATSQDAAAKIVNVLDKVAENIPIEDGNSSKVLSTKNLVLQANKVNKASFQGISFGIKENGSVAVGDKSAISVELPTSVMENSNEASTRIGFIHYANNKLFQSQLEGNKTKLSKNVLSSSVYNTNTSNLSKPVKLRMPRVKGEDGESLRNSSCVYWDLEGRKWLGDGCTLCSEQDSSNQTVQCCCDHLTNFAVLFSPQPSSSVVPEEKTIHTKVLTIITYVGCGISFIGVILTFLTYLLFRHLRKTNQQPILMNLCVAIGLLLVVFVISMNITSYRLGCQIVAVLLHYLTLVTVLWMGIEAYNLYLQIVKVMAIYKRKFMLKAALVGWGVPLIVVLATLAAAIIQYKQSDGDVNFYYGNDQVCILHEHLYRIVAWFAPILVILVLNFLMFFVVVHKLQCTGAMVPVETKSAQRKRCWTALAIMCLLGLTWLFGAMAISDARIVFEYLFCIFNSLQGFFIFFFHCVRIPEVRKQWSFFVSGLGFSHKGSENSQQRSRGIGESHHNSHDVAARRVRPKSWTPKDDQEVPRKGTMLTTADDNSQNGNVYEDFEKEDIELDNVNSHSNYGMDKPC